MDSVSESEDALLNTTSHIASSMIKASFDARASSFHLLSVTEGALFDPGKTLPTWSLATFILTLLASFFLTWRLWTFVVRPWLKPDEPKEMPYWTPYIGNSPEPRSIATIKHQLNSCKPGHTLSFFQNSNALITRSRSMMRNGDPYSLTMSGERFYMLNTPHDAAAVFRNTKTLAWEPYLKKLMASFTVPQSSFGKIWDPPTLDDPRYTNPLNPKHRSLIHHGEHLYRLQLLPGPNLDDFSNRLLGLIDLSLHQENPSNLFRGKHPTSVTDFCAHVQIEAMTRSLFGDHIYEIEPSLTQMLYDFSEEAWKLLMFPFPKFAARKLHTAKQGILSTLLKYIQSTSEKKNEAAWFWAQILSEQKAANLDDDSRVGITFMLLWAANINVYRLSAWVVSYILCDPELLATIRAEIRPAFHDNAIDYSHLYDHCPCLTAIHIELLRLTFGSFSVRKVVAPIVIGGKKLLPGNSVIVPIRSLHYDADVFGSDATQFDANRFLDKPQLEKSTSYRPFAGGITYCPGRFLAKRQNVGFAAMLLHRFDMEVVGRERGPKGEMTPPKIDQDSPSLGIMSAVKGTELFVRFKETAKEANCTEAEAKI